MVFEVGIEARRPWFRRTVYSWDEAVKIANSYARIGGIHHTVYRFISTTTSRKGRERPDYDTAIFNKVYVESDDDSMIEIDTMRDWFKKNGVRVKYFFTGRGFYAIFPVIYEAGANKFNILYNVQDMFRDELDVDVHPCIAGVFAQTRRMCGTWNPKRGRYCIWLKDEDLDLSYEEIREMALHKRPDPDGWTVGKPLDVTKFDHEIPDRGVRMVLEGTIKVAESADDALAEYGLSVRGLCPFMKSMVTSRRMGHEGRFYTILYLKDKVGVLSPSAARDLFYNILDRDEFDRSMDEGQFEDAFSRTKDGRWRYKFNCSVMKRSGICDQDCREVV